MKHIKPLLLLLAFTSASPAIANEMVLDIGAKSARNVAHPTMCGMQEQINMSVNFNIRAKGFADAKTKFDAKMKQVTTFATQQNLKKFDLQSMNYSIYAQNNGNASGDDEGNYQLNGSASYQLDSADSAFKLGEFLTQQKFQVNINANAYKNGMCNNSTQPVVE